MTENNNIIFAAISPHPPLILPSIGMAADRAKVRQTVQSLQILGEKLKNLPVQSVVISSPHPDWGVEVPLYFLNPFNGQASLEKYRFLPDFEINQKDDSVATYPLLTSSASPTDHFQWGRKAFQKIKRAGFKTALIASGDLSHCLKPDGPYGFHEQGPQFDKDLIKSLKDRHSRRILQLADLYPQAAECGLRSICFILGILEESGASFQTKILSYENFFGVGYLTAEFELS